MPHTLDKCTGLISQSPKIEKLAINMGKDMGYESSKDGVIVIGLRAIYFVGMPQHVAPERYVVLVKPHTSLNTASRSMRKRMKHFFCV